MFLQGLVNEHHLPKVSMAVRRLVKKKNVFLVHLAQGLHGTREILHSTKSCPRILPARVLLAELTEQSWTPWLSCTFPTEPTIKAAFSP